jgi:hypothetical protein
MLRYVSVEHTLALREAKGGSAMNVLIIETKTGKLAASIPIVLQGMNYTPTEEQYYAEAWKCAVDDKSVDANRKKDYTFKLQK